MFEQLGIVEISSSRLYAGLDKDLLWGAGDQKEIF